MSATVPDVRLTDADLERFSEWFYKRTGIQFTRAKRYFVDKRVAACIQDAGARDFGDWFSRIRLTGDAALEQQLINRLTVHETYFFREDYQLEALVEELLPRVLAARGDSERPVRILSLPCSTGDEPYSIAIWLMEQWAAIDHVDVELVACDIDAESVAQARRGVFGARALQRVSPDQRKRWFEPAGGGEHRISADLRGAIDFRVANVCDVAEARRFRDFDVIFCRNLLIYFDERSSRRAAENLYGMLRPGGWLLLGHSESMSRISSIFEPVRLPEATAYRRPQEDGQ